MSLYIGSSGQQRQIFTQDGRHIDLEKITAVWFRRAIQPISLSDSPKAERIFVSGEYRHFWNGLILDADVLWVNHPHYVYLAEHKLLQLRVALEMGFRIPETLVARSPKLLREFVQNVGPAICKPIFHGRFVDSAGEYSVYTRRVSKEDLLDDEALEACPLLVQEEIPRQADMRVTFIGNNCFAARIFCEDQFVIDWRRPDAGVSYEIAEIPHKIQSKCEAMMARWRLRYAAFDFIEASNGDWVFLEVNPTGEWAWLEECLGFPMRDTFIDLFYGNSL